MQPPESEPLDDQVRQKSDHCLLLKVNNTRVMFSTFWAPVACHTLGFHMKASESEWSNQRQEDSIT